MKLPNNREDRAPTLVTKWKFQYLKWLISDLIVDPKGSMGTSKQPRLLPRSLFENWQQESIVEDNTSTVVQLFTLHRESTLVPTYSLDPYGPVLLGAECTLHSTYPRRKVNTNPALTYDDVLPAIYTRPTVAQSCGSTQLISGLSSGPFYQLELLDAAWMSKNLRVDNPGT